MVTGIRIGKSPYREEAGPPTGDGAMLAVLAQVRTGQLMTDLAIRDKVRAELAQDARVAVLMTVLGSAAFVLYCFIPDKEKLLSSFPTLRLMLAATMALLIVFDLVYVVQRWRKTRALKRAAASPDQVLLDFYAQRIQNTKDVLDKVFLPAFQSGSLTEEDRAMVDRAEADARARIRYAEALIAEFRMAILFWSSAPLLHRSGAWLHVCSACDGLDIYTGPLEALEAFIKDVMSKSASGAVSRRKALKQIALECEELSLLPRLSAESPPASVEERPIDHERGDEPARRAHAKT